MARRQIDQKPPDLAIAHRGEPRRDDLQMPIRPEAGARIELGKDVLRKRGEIGVQQRRILRGAEPAPPPLGPLKTCACRKHS